MSSKHNVATRRPSWSSEFAGQGQYGHHPTKSLHGSSDWSPASEPFPDFDKQDRGVEDLAQVVTLTPSDLETSTSHASKHPFEQYLSSSPCTSDNTNISDNDMSSQCSSSFDSSAMAVPHSEMKWQYMGQVNKKKEHEVSAANRAPPEILSQIYAMLSPRDFDNARRTCSQWMRASLQQKLLENMLKRAGWWDAWRRDCQIYRPVHGIEESIVWRLSKRFATESVLSGRKVNVEQTGFLPTGVVDFGQLSRESLPKESPGLSRDMFTGTAPRLTAALRDPAFSRSVKFSVSTCGHYVLAATGCMIYVYYLGGVKRADSSLARFAEGITDDLALSDGELDILPVSSIGCPYEVLSATIDTSTPRFAIAALLRGRIGMICDIKGVRIHPPNEQTSVLPRGPSTRDNIPAEHAKKMEEFRDAIASSAVIEPTATSNTRPPMGPRTVSTRRTMNRLTRAPRKYFHDVCSVEDPPRSVSICPGRRCIAFGCGSGIELHWVDEKTLEDSRKMFPLSQPAEVLHFLPSRVEIDEVSKLRLISSLAGPGGSGCQCHRAANGEDVICQFHLSSRVNSLPHWTPRRNGHLSLVKATHCHHYRAMPVNDGLHILFIEPVTGYLCIGSDAPIGGPTNLTRAMICIPPSDHELQSDEDRIPTIFAVGSDLSRGLRIVAAYQDRIVLYTVPVDVYNVLRRERQLQGDGVIGDSDLARDWFLDNERNSKRRGSLAQNQNGDWEFLLRVSYRPTAALWPLKIYGKEIGRMVKIVDFSVQTSSGGVRVWAFGASGEARIFDIDTHTSKARPIMDVPIKALNIASDGSIGSAMFVGRAESGLLSPLPTKATRKRKHLSQPAAFDRSLLGLGDLRNLTPSNSDNDRLTCDSTNTTFPTASSRQATGTGTSGWSDRRQSFAACIMDLRIPELSIRDGQWMETERASTVPTTPSCGLETTMFDNSDVEFADFHDVASYDPQEIRKFYTVWSTSSSKPTAGRWR